jgi:hypothetical protein
VAAKERVGGSQRHADIGENDHQKNIRMSCIYNWLFANKLLFEAIDETNLDKLHLAIQSGADLNKPQKHTPKDNYYYFSSSNIENKENRIKSPIGFAFEKYVHYCWVYPKKSYIYTKLFDNMYTIILTLMEHGASIHEVQKLHLIIIWHYNFYQSFYNNIQTQLQQRRCVNALQLLMKNSYKINNRFEFDYICGYFCSVGTLSKVRSYPELLNIFLEAIFLLYLLGIDHSSNGCFYFSHNCSYNFDMLMMYYCLDQKNIFIGYCFS